MIGEVSVTLGGPFKPLPVAVEGDTTERLSEPDYERWTLAQLRHALTGFELFTHDGIAVTSSERGLRLHDHLCGWDCELRYRSDERLLVDVLDRALAHRADGCTAP